MEYILRIVLKNNEIHEFNFMENEKDLCYETCFCFMRAEQVKDAKIYEMNIYETESLKEKLK